MSELTTLLVDGGEVTSLTYSVESHTFTIGIAGEEDEICLSLDEAPSQMYRAMLKSRDQSIIGRMIKPIVLEIKNRIVGMKLEMIGKLAGYKTRQQANVSEAYSGNGSPAMIEKLGVIVCGFVLIDRAGEDACEILEMNGHTKSDFDLGSKKARKEPNVSVLSKLPMHKANLVRQLKLRLVKCGDGTSKAEPEDFLAVAESTYAEVQAAADVAGKCALMEAKQLSKDEFIKQSAVVAKRWWGQAAGKGQDAAPVIKANFKAALARGPGGSSL